VYMRYGMEEEAEKQVRLALKLEETNGDAHAKMVQIQRAKGDNDAAQGAITAAKAVLAGGALLAFENAIAGEGSVSESLNAVDDVPEDGTIGVFGTADFGDEVDSAKESPEVVEDAEFDFDFSAAGEPDDSSDVLPDVEKASKSEPMSDDTGSDFGSIDFDFDVPESDDGDTSATEEASDETPAHSLDSVDSAELDSIEVDFDIEDLNIDTSDLVANEADDFDSTVILNTEAKSAPVAETEQTLEEKVHFANIDDALSDSTVVLNSDPMADDFSATAELSNIKKTLDSIDSLHDDPSDPTIETFGASQELDALMQDLDGLLDDEDKKNNIS
jgi:hypothetical protein